MLRLDRAIKPWRESGALNSQINLYGFWNEQTFLTKSGDLGIVLRVRGVDYESLDQTAQEYAVKRLEAALKTFGVGFHLPAHVYNFAHSEQRGSEGGAGAPTSCEQSHYAGSLRSGGNAE